MWRGIVFDGDDTLWETEVLYDKARERARAVVENADLDGARWEALERQIDVANVARLGHAPARFPKSCVDAYEALCAEIPREIVPAIRDAIRQAAEDVFSQPATLMPFARETLEALAARGCKLALHTKGDPDVQRLRIEQSGLADLFDVIEIVDEKTPESLSAVIEHLGLDPASVLSVGNSVRSDVLPALAAAVQPVWIDAHVWEYERDHDPLLEEGVIELDSLRGVLDVAAA